MRNTANTSFYDVYEHRTVTVRELRWGALLFPFCLLKPLDDDLDNYSRFLRTVSDRRFLVVCYKLRQSCTRGSRKEWSDGLAALACSPPSLPRSPEEALHSLLPHERRRSSLQPALTDSCPLVCRR